MPRLEPQPLETSDEEEARRDSDSPHVPKRMPLGQRRSNGVVGGALAWRSRLRAHVSGRTRLCLIVGLALAAAGCGGSGVSVPRHGILFTYLAKPTNLAAGGDIYVWDPGSPPRRIFQTKSPPVDPLWSRDGTKIAWSMEPPALCQAEADECGQFGCEDQVYVSRAGGPPERVSPEYRDSSGNEGCSDAESWSPDGRRLLILRQSLSAPSHLAILDPLTEAVQPLHLPDVGYGAAWGKPGIAYVYARTTRIHRSPYSHTTYEIRIVSPRTGKPRFVIALSPLNAPSGLAWSAQSELATIQRNRVVIYSSTRRRVADFAGPRYPEAPARGSGVVWSPSGKRLLVCVDQFGGLSPKAREAHLDTQKKRDRYPPLVPYVVDRNGTHWRRLELPHPQPRETACSATSWR